LFPCTENTPLRAKGVRCGHCGCILVGEIKKGRYVYYHCTGNRGKCQEPYTRQEILTEAFANVLRELVIPQQVLEWIGDTVLECDRTEQAAREQTIKRLQAQHNQIESRIETMYMDKLDGRITKYVSSPPKKIVYPTIMARSFLAAYAHNVLFGNTEIL
jgi:hypothetical protein